MTISLFRIETDPMPVWAGLTLRRY